MSVEGPNPYSPPAAAIDEAGAPAPEGNGFKSALPLAKAITVAMGVFVVAELLVVLNAILAMGVMGRVVAGETVGQAELVAIDDRTEPLTLLLRVLMLASIVLFCFFMVRANRNARAFGSPMSTTPGWAAGWFFIPLLYLWKPYYAMKEIWQGSEPDPTVQSLNPPVPALLPLWWWMYLAFLFGRWGWSSGYKNQEGPAAFISMSRGRIVVAAITIVAALLAAAVVRGVARRQEERQRRQPRAPLPATAGVAP